MSKDENDLTWAIDKAVGDGDAVRDVVAVGVDVAVRIGEVVDLAVGVPVLGGVREAFEDEWGAYVEE